MKASALKDQRALHPPSGGWGEVPTATACESRGQVLLSVNNVQPSAHSQAEISLHGQASPHDRPSHAPPTPLLRCGTLMPHFKLPLHFLFLLSPLSCGSDLDLPVDDVPPLLCEPGAKEPCECKSPSVRGERQCADDGSGYTRCFCGGSRPGDACEATIEPLPFNATDAEYAPSLQRIVIVSSNPAALHILNPIDASWLSVPLSRDPRAVAVAKSTPRAAVAHDGQIAIVNLEAAQVTDVFTVTPDAGDLLLSDAGKVYMFPGTNGYEDLYALDIETGTEAISGTLLFNKARARLHPEEDRLYLATQLTPSDIKRYNILDPSTAFAYDSPYHGEHPVCGNIWLSADGTTLVSACGNTFAASNDPIEDLRFRGELTGLRIRALSHAPIRQEWAFLPQEQPNTEGQDGDVLHVLSETPSGSEKLVQLPCVTTKGEPFPAEGRFVMPTPDDLGYSVLLSTLASDGEGNIAITTVYP